MSDINICTFTGRLAADPECKTFQSGGRICNMRMAVGSQWKDKSSGERKERVEWISVVISNDGLVGVAEKFLRKGSRIAISGEFRTRKWTTQNGDDRYSTEIVLTPFNGSLTMLDGKPDGDQRGSQRRAPDGSRGAPADTGGGWADDLDDDIPWLRSDGIW